MECFTSYLGLSSTEPDSEFVHSDCTASIVEGVKVKVERDKEPTEGKVK